jgi:hypothetical protein
MSVALLLAAGCTTLSDGKRATTGAAGPVRPAAVAALSPYIDVHTHIDRARGREAIEDAVSAMPLENSAKYLFLPSPFPERSERSFDLEEIREAAARHRREVAVIGGGGTLNPMIQEAVRAGSTSPELERRFRERAYEIVRLGAAGFGEFAAEHRPSASTPSYQSVPPDHRLFLLLADIAAENGLSITLHLEAVPQDMAVPPSWKVSGLTPPARLRANIAGFERLLDHNARARIVWAHGGWDNTGFRTPELCGRLLQAHPNLYMELKIDPLRPGLNSPLTGGASGALKPEWLQLFRDYPDRFVMGSDQHYPRPDEEIQRWQAAVRLFNELPPDLRRRFGMENVYRIYRMGS